MSVVPPAFVDVDAAPRDASAIRLLAAAAEHADMPLVITEARLERPGPRFVYVNRAFSVLTGYAPEEIVGKTPRLLQGPRTDRAVLDRLRRDLRAHRRFRGETVNYRKDGTPYVVEWHVTPLTDSEDRVTHWLSAQRDVTARALAEEERHRLRDELKQIRQTLQATEAASAEAERTFLAHLSHEVRTPLTAVLGFSSLLARQGSEKHRRFARRIEAAGERLMHTLDLLIELARLDAGDAPSAPEMLDVAREVERIVEPHRSRARERGATLHLDVAAEARGLRTPLDASALTALLDVLLSRTIQSVNQGMITVHLDRPDPSSPALRLALRLAEDESVGLMDDPAPAASRHTHADDALSLTLARRLAERMGASIEASHAADGTRRFSVRFAAAEPSTAAEQGAPTTETDETAAQSAHVLIVEDNHDTGVLMQSLLEDMAEVSLARSAEEALTAAGDHPFDLVLLDINLGSGQNGADVLKTLRDRDDYRETPIVAITAYALPGDREHFLEMGFTDYVAKPFKVDELLELVGTLLPG